MAEKIYYQCKLRQSIGDGYKQTTAWIESRGAKAGLTVELLPDHERWLVVSVFQPGKSESLLKHDQLLNRGSLPSVERMGK